MKTTIHIHKADPFPDRAAVNDMEIAMDRELPEGLLTPASLDLLFAADAKAIEAALHLSLPGGTYNRIYRLMTNRITRLPLED